MKALAVQKVTAFVILALAFWIPSTGVNAYQAARGRESPLFLVGVLLLPILFVVGGFIMLCNHYSLHNKRSLWALLCIYIIWATGPLFTMLNATFYGQGFNNPDTYRFVLKAMFIYPYSTFVFSTYDGTLGALIVVTIWLIIIAVIDAIYYNKRIAKA